jgi:hypothetical protein
MRRTSRIIIWASLLPILFGFPCAAEDWTPYYGIDSGEEISAAELERRAAVRRQVQLNDALRWRAGLPPSNGVFYYPLPGDFESIYAFGPSRSFGRSVFTPWPYVPGDIWGYQHIPPSRQSIGQVETQTGPNTWESRPVYATAPEEPATVPAPEIAAPEEPAVEALPPRGPREF